MVIKPLEKKSDPIFFLKLLFLVSLVATGIFLDRFFVRKNIDVPSILGKTKETERKQEKKTSDFIEDSLKKTQKLGESVLGETTNFIQNTAENISTSVSDLIYENSLGKIVDQIDKLPKDQQERIKDQICK